MTSDDRDEYDCPTPHRPGPVARQLSRSVGGAWANVWLTLLMGTARLAHVVAGQRRERDLTPSAQGLAREGRPAAELRDEIAVSRARRAYT